MINYYAEACAMGHCMLVGAGTDNIGAVKFIRQFNFKNSTICL